MYDLKTFNFGKGSHQSRDKGMCVNECAAYLAGEPHSDHPQCLCPVIAPLSIWVNDSCEDDLRNELLRDLPWRLVGTKATPEIEHQRAYMAADWAVRFLCPILLRRAGMDSHAVTLESLPVVDSKETANAAADAAKAAADAANAAYAAYAAAYDLEVIQRSCVELLDRMIRLTEPQEIVPAQLVRVTHSAT